ncbi:MAG TPA: imidazolonepropionase [Pyrinomonadaceae bacterium]|nr:imidazolonepropionase [Pyrinomonadaceae bacterium]
MQHADSIIHNAGQLVTCAPGGKPKRGTEMLDVGIIADGAVAINDGNFVGVGTSADILLEFQSDEIIDVEGRVVCPGFVDPHTHIVFAGDRLNEFELKIKGAAYLEILANGGGIISTVRQTREASVETLVDQSLARLDKMLAFGTTTCEIKTGYGLDTANELKMLEVIAELDRVHPIAVVPTFLAAHAVPPEFKESPDNYVDLICDTMLSAAWKWFVASDFHGRVPFFCDVFCENGAFSVDQSRRILETAKGIGFKIKAHVDQFTNLGGAKLAMDLGGTSIDHLDAIGDDEIDLLAKSDTIGMVIPTENFNAGKTKYANARKLIDTGCAVALSTDYNPGSAPCPSQPMAMAISCRYQKLLPSEALNAATINAAYAVGLGETVGSIEVGKRADLAIFEAQDYRQIAYEFGGDLIAAVYCGGVAV